MVNIMKTFEYKSRYLFGDTVEKVDEFMRTLNTMGSDGWGIGSNCAAPE